MSGQPASQEEQLATLDHIDEASESLQKKGQYLEALQCMEKGLMLRGHIFGLDSVQVHHACKSVGSMCNYIAMAYLQKDEFEIALELLKKAEVLTEKHPTIRAVTFNNMGCFFRKKGKLRTALRYVSKALKIEEKLEAAVKSSDTHLNMCTILSELRRHDKALIHAKAALKLMLMELFGPDGHVARLQAENAAKAAEAGEEVQDNSQIKLPPDRVAVLAIAYHNLAVQQEFLGKHRASLSSYDKACKVVNTHLGADHPLVQSLSSSQAEAQRKVDVLESRKKRPGRKSSQSTQSRVTLPRRTQPVPLSSDDLKMLQKNITRLHTAQERPLASQSSNRGDVDPTLEISAVSDASQFPPAANDTSLFMSDDDEPVKTAEAAPAE